MQRYLVLIEKGPSSYGAYAPDVPGCVAVGKTAQEALQRFEEALESHLELIQEDGESVPEATYVEAHFVEVRVPTSVPVTSDL
jgi:predicted RNase H-like HicB family nuclease